MAIQLVWFKRDLRVDDHEPLKRASERGPCLCLYVYEPEIIEAPDFDAAHLQFINESLEALDRNLKRLGGLLIRRHGSAVNTLAKLHRRLPFAKIWAHEETTNDVAYQRDRSVRAWAKKERVAFCELPQYGVIRRLESRGGWAKKWEQRFSQKPISPPLKLEPVQGLEPGPVLVPATVCKSRIARERIQQGGIENANDTLHSFLSHRGENYRVEMSSPVSAEQSCSRLSPHLAQGTISLRRVFQATRQKADELKQIKKDGGVISPLWLKSLSSFQSRLRWHCHFMQKMEDEPTIEFENFNSAYDGLRESEFRDSFFDAWCHGQTGFPMVDACMRALQKTGWINFRMRAMLVSFASYHLWLHWRKPALHLARLFLDYEPGIHYSQIQMQSGVTGINTIRIYSPVKQAKDQDPRGTFVRQYLPELADVPDKFIFEPHKMNLMEQSLFGCKLDKDYPKPIVDHLTAYRKARDRMFARKKEKRTQEASRAVYQKHGSRKRHERSF